MVATWWPRGVQTPALHVPADWGRSEWQAAKHGVRELELFRALQNGDQHSKLARSRSAVRRQDLTCLHFSDGLVELTTNLWHEAAVLFKARALLTTRTRKAGEGELVEAGGNKKEYDIFFLSPLQIHILPRQAPRGL